MTNEEIKKGLYICAVDSDDPCGSCPLYEASQCYNDLKLEARGLIIEQEKEIARLQEKLKAVLLSIDTVKEMNTMCNVEAQIKQAKIDVLNKLKTQTHNYYPSIDCYCVSQHVVLVRDIDKMIAEVQNAEDKD